MSRVAIINPLNRALCLFYADRTFGDMDLPWWSTFKAFNTEYNRKWALAACRHECFLKLREQLMKSDYSVRDFVIRGSADIHVWDIASYVGKERMARISYKLSVWNKSKMA